jgi:hypothetical protein
VPTSRFFTVLSLSLVACCAGYTALVLTTATCAEAVLLRTSYTYNWFPRGYTASEFWAVRTALWVVASVAVLLGAWLARTSWGQDELTAWAEQARAAWQGAGWLDLTSGQRKLAGVGLLALLATRTYYSLIAQPYDDMTSYEWFVREPLLVVSAVYPYPNNHILSNTLAWCFYQVYPHFWWAMRLPVLLTGAAATMLWFLVLLRRTNFVVSFVAVGWFSLYYLSFYESTVGRGYWLLVLLGGVGFWALLSLQAAWAAGVAAQPRIAWAALLLSGVLGLYTVPTHSFFLLSTYSWLALCAMRHRATRQLLLLVSLGGLTLLGAGLLYTPLLLLSGAKALFHNPFVLPMTAREFWATLPESLLLRHRLIGIPLVMGVIISFGWLWRQAQCGALPGRQAQWLSELGGPSLWLLVLPYLIALVGRIQPPERTFFYKAQYLFIVAALLINWLRERPGTDRRRWRALLLAGTLAFASSQLVQLLRQREAWHNNFPFHLGAPAAEWLLTQAPGPVLAPDLSQFTVLRFYARQNHPDYPWHIDHRPQPGVRYRYLAIRPDETELPRPGQPVYQNRMLHIYLVR